LPKDEWRDADPSEILELVDKKWDAFFNVTWPSLNEYVTTGLATPIQTP
jgi:hypothetical protein